MPRPPHNHNPERYIGTTEAGELLAVSPKTITRWAQEGKLPYLRTIGGHRRFAESTIRALRDRLQIPITDPGQNEQDRQDAQDEREDGGV